MQGVVTEVEREKIASGATRAPAGPVRFPRLREALLVCGALSSLIYVAANVVCPMVWKEYSSFNQTISELSAIDAPSRPTWIPFGIVYGVLLLAFGIGVWQSASGTRGLRVSAALLVAMGANMYWPPMHLRGHVATLTDTMHATMGAVISTAIMFAIGFGATALGKRFRFYSIATIVVLLVSGSATFLYAPRLAANLPTPGMGLIERIDLGAYLLWVAVLAVGLLRRERTA